MASPSPYRPPEQSSAGQLFDSLFVVALVAATLLVCLYLTVLSAAPTPEPAAQTAAVAEAPAPAAEASINAAPAPAAAVAAAPTGDGLTPEQQKLKTERFTALGWDDAKVAERKAAIAAKSYEIDWFMLILTAIVVIGYFVFLVRASDKELREVINERFGSPTGTQSKESS